MGGHVDGDDGSTDARQPGFQPRSVTDATSAEDAAAVHQRPTRRPWARGVLLAVAALVAAVATRRACGRLRRRQLTWGATPAEAEAPLPGDGFVPAADLIATRAITVAAPAERVWPWIAQLGQGRGGFYSYDRLENLVGCRIHSARTVVPEWQDIRVGDAVHLHPEVALEVAEVEPGRALVLRGAVPVAGAAATNARAAGGHSTDGRRKDTEVDAAAEVPYDFSWAFVLADAEEDGSTRLLVRERYGYLRPGAAMLVEPVAVVSFLMTQRMLRGIRDRAEAA